MGDSDSDPSAIRSLAVSPDDAVDAFVYTRENPGEAVLRVTPPFHGRMRARLHVYRVDDAPLTGAVHVDPAAIIDDQVVADYPELDDRLESVDSEETERLRERHAEAVESWRTRARDALLETVTIETPDGPQEVRITPLG
ncbi:hypothetical protein [Halopiger goleimassiliensis]|uniref:hypothetical protein n=1 Tax=Halopiger goleimassiliensis TaxID=1293048 RepID=UPI000677E283|nr:hypothetical protein [Halopiger goleimassiliensis]